MKDTKRLARRYDRLTPEERFPLIVAAVDRGDEVERLRLQESAPMTDWSLSDHHTLASSTIAVAKLYFMDSFPATKK